MKKIAVLLLTILLFKPFLSAKAEESLAKYFLKDTPIVGNEMKGSVRENVLEIVSMHHTASTTTILEIQNPPITKRQYALRGKVAHIGVNGDAYLELLNTLSDKNTYFSRTLSPTGPLSVISGSSNYRDFILPFFLDEEATTVPSPTKLTLSLIMPSTGTITLKDLELIQFERGENIGLTSDGNYFENGGLVGGILGIVGGLLGAVIGIASSRSRNRALVLGLYKLSLALGIILLLLGIVFWIMGFIWGIYYPFLLSGVIITIVIGANLNRIRQRFEEIELRKMKAKDV